MKPTIDTYRFSSGEEPSEEILYRLTHEAITAAVKRDKEALEKWFRENQLGEQKDESSVNPNCSTENDTNHE